MSCRVPFCAPASSRRRASASALIALLPALATALVSAWPAPVAAEKYAGEFLQLGVGARALGMGGSFVAMADDASAAYWNPAGLTRLEQAEMLFMHAEQFGSLATHDYIGFAQPMSGSDARSAVGIGLVRFAVDDIQITRDAFEDLDGDGEWDEGEPILPDRFRTGSDDEYGLFLSYARDIGDRLSLGGNVKLIRQGLLDNTSFGMGLDLGMLFRPTPQWSVGALLADATGTRISWDSGYDETRNPSLTFGTSWTSRVDMLRGSITAGVALASTFEGREEASQVAGGEWGGDFRGGLEYWYAGAVAARVGSDAGDLTAGAGLRYRGLGADYAYLSHEELDATHRVSASVRF